MDIFIRGILDGNGTIGGLNGFKLFSLIVLLSEFPVTSISGSDFINSS